MKNSVIKPITYIQLRKLLDGANISQRQAARLLEINERTVRRYCAGTNMKASELVTQLQTLIDQHGDLEVTEINTYDGGLTAVTEVGLYVVQGVFVGTKVFLLGF